MTSATVPSVTSGRLSSGKQGTALHYSKSWLRQIEFKGQLKQNVYFKFMNDRTFGLLRDLLLLRPGHRWRHEKTSVDMLDWLIQANDLMPVFQRHGAELH